MQALSKAIEVVGSQRALAEGCGVVQTAVAAWLKRGTVPPEHCALIEQATKGEVTRKELRPADWQRIWPELADQPDANGVDSQTQPQGQGA
jgi:DNA-binding transcriptional regulator YdaS (Cro superfamily)